MQKFHIALATAAAALTITASAIAAEEHRELGPHVHGHGRLNIALEGKRVSMQLEVPGADIVGFEHEPSTPEQKAAVEKAKTILADALAVFKFSPSAHCSVASAKVMIKAEDEHDHDEAEHEANETEHHHSEFHAEYALDCAAPEKLSSIDFSYFKLFKGAQELDINLVTPDRQTHYEVTREQPRLDMGKTG